MSYRTALFTWFYV